MIPFRAINEAALPKLESILRRWLAGGQRKGREYVALNPTRRDRHLGSFRINLDTGRWSDFATGDRGGDVISLIAYIDRLRQTDAARRLAGELGIPLSTTDRSPVKRSQQAQYRVRRQHQTIRAGFWRLGRLASLEAAKVAAFEAGEMSLLAAAASEARQLQGANDSELAALWQAARAVDRKTADDCETWGVQSVEQARSLGALAIDILAEAEQTISIDRSSAVAEVAA